MLSQVEIEYLKGVSVFAALSSDALVRIGKCARRVDYPADQLVFREGEPAKEMVIVLEGRLEVFKRGRNGLEARIAVLGPGDLVGEMSLVDIQPRSADVRALEPTSVVVLSHADIASVYRDDPQSYTLMLLNIAREISIRLRRMDTMLANIVTEIAELTGKPSGRHGSQGE